MRAATRWLSGLGLALVGLSAFVPAAEAANPVVPQQRASSEMDGIDTARVSAIEGTVYGRGPYDEETFELASNAVLRAGDEVFTDEGTFAEVEFHGQTFLRLAGSTTIVVQRVDENGVEVALTEGAAYLSRGPNAAPARFQSFAGAVDVGSRSQVRVANDANKTNFLASVADGSAELRTNDNATPIRAGQTLVWTSGKTSNRAFEVARGDAFDRWNDDRERKVRNLQRSPNVPADAIGSHELEGNGTWVMIDGHYAWRPTVVVAGWRPYRNGYWSWTEPYGWTWIAYEPWGYTTHHYGRWYYRGHHGWVWYPGAQWGAAWVVWAAFGANVGWAPCDFWGRPIYVHSYYSYYDYGAWNYTSGYYFHHGGGYYYHGGGHHGGHGNTHYPDGHGGRRTVTTSTHREGTGGAAAANRRVGKGVGRNGEYEIREFDAQTIRQHTPVPVKEPSRELTPKHIVAAADKGLLRGVDKSARRGDLLDRTVKEGGVRPEPWGRDADRFGGRDQASDAKLGGSRLGGGRDANGSRGNDRGLDAGRIPGGRDASPRAGEGWTPRGAKTDDSPRDGARGADAFGGGRTHDAGRSNDSGRSTDAFGGGRDSGRTNDASRSRDAFGGGREPRSEPAPSRSEPRAEPRTAPAPTRSEPRSEPRTAPAPARSEPRSEPRTAPVPSRSEPRSAPAPKSDDGGGRKGGKRSGWSTPGSSNSGYASSTWSPREERRSAPVTRSQPAYAPPAPGRSSSKSSGSSVRSSSSPSRSSSSSKLSSPSRSSSSSSKSSSSRRR